MEIAACLDQSRLAVGIETVIDPQDAIVVPAAVSSAIDDEPNWR